MKDTSFAFGHLIDEAKLMLGSYDKDIYFFFHTRKQGNFVAHNLTRYSNDFSMWNEDVSPHIEVVILADMASHALKEFAGFFSKKKVLQ